MLCLQKNNMENYLKCYSNIPRINKKKDPFHLDVFFGDMLQNMLLLQKRVMFQLRTTIINLILYSYAKSSISKHDFIVPNSIFIHLAYYENV